MAVYHVNSGSIDQLDVTGSIRISGLLNINGTALQWQCCEICLEVCFIIVVVIMV